MGREDGTAGLSLADLEGELEEEGGEEREDEINQEEEDAIDRLIEEALARERGVNQPRGKGVDPTALELEEAEFLRSVSRPKAKACVPVPEQLSRRLEKTLEGRGLNQLTHFHERLLQEKEDRFAEIGAALSELATDKDGNKILQDAVVPPLRYSWKHTLGYTAFDLLPHYGLTRRILRDVMLRCPEQDRERYTTMLDFGGGPGTAVLAARDERMLPALNEATIVEPSRSMWEVAVQLVLGHIDYRKEAVEDILKRLQDEKDAKFGLLWCPSLPRMIRGLDPQAFAQYDVVNATFALSELPSNASRAVTVGILWQMVKPGGVLIIAERGDPTSQIIVQEARMTMLEDQERMNRALHRLIKIEPFEYQPRVLGPCTHAKPCPIFKEDAEPGTAARYGRGCMFYQEVPLSVTNRSSRGQGLGTPSLGMAYSYVAFQKPHDPTELDAPGAPADDARFGTTSRLLRNPLTRKQHVVLDMCTSDAELKRTVVTKRRLGEDSVARLVYRAARKSLAGGLWAERADAAKAEQGEDQAGQAGQDQEA